MASYCHCAQFVGTRKHGADTNLNAPPDPQLAHANWILPGRSTWQWLAIGDPREDDQKQWVDWTSQLGFDYYLIDEGWNRWE